VLCKTNLDKRSGVSGEAYSGFPGEGANALVSRVPDQAKRCCAGLGCQTEKIKIPAPSGGGKKERVAPFVEESFCVGQS